MQNEVSQEINKRFFQKLDELVAKGVTTYYGFCVRYDIPRRNFIRLKNEPQREFQMAWLKAMVEDYGASASWLITGQE
ncbi:hypothetical protein [Pedobacter panaciterrae]